MKEYECVQVSHHKDVGKTIAEWETNGWCLHSYVVAGSPTAVNHYLLFKKGEQHRTVPQFIKQKKWFRGFFLGNQTNRRSHKLDENTETGLKKTDSGWFCVSSDQLPCCKCYSDSKDQPRKMEYILYYDQVDVVGWGCS